MSDAVNTGRRRFLTAATCVVGAGGAAGVAVPFLASWNPSAKAKAAGAPVKRNISKLEPGAMIVVEWRGKPVYILRRTAEQLTTIPKLNDVVADPNSERPQQPEYCQNEYRSRKEDIFIAVGLCTHLGCAPKYRPEVAPNDLGADWIGGFFCPCHGSRFDLAGRVYKGVPAPSNLEVPPYTFESDSVVIIGV